MYRWRAPHSVSRLAARYLLPGNNSAASRPPRLPFRHSASSRPQPAKMAAIESAVGEYLLVYRHGFASITMTPDFASARRHAIARFGADDDDDTHMTRP